jgi:hypothetical protein
MFVEDNAAHPVECDSNGRLVLVLNLNLLGQVWQPAFDYNGRLEPFKFLKRLGHYYLQEAVTPYQITQQNRLQRAGDP